MIRLEQGAWTDRSTTVVLHRDFCPCDLSVTQTPELLTVRTEYLEICYRPGSELKDGLTIRGIHEPGFFWRFGRKPLQNLGGTVSTLDNVDGDCHIEDGICAIDGFAVLDDSKSALFDDEGWLMPREAATDVYFFGYGHDYTACVQDYYRLTGAPRMLPAYVLGNWWCRYYPYSHKEYLDLMDEFQRRDVPLSVGVVDMDWHLTSGEDWRPDHNGWTVHFRGMNRDICFLVDGKIADSRFGPDTHTHTVVLEDIGTDQEVQITMSSDSNMLYDNRDIRKRFLNCLVRVQCGDFEKKELNAYMERLCRYLNAGGAYRPDKAAYSPHDSMRTKMWELASIELWMRK